MSVFAILAALLCLAFLIFWHELGHFLAARACGVYVERFSVGFGKVLLRWQDRQGTEFCLSALPLGGYVRMYGEDTPGQGAHSQVPARAKAFQHATLWQKLLIVLAGPAANILLTWCILSFIQLQGTTSLRPYIDTPADSSVAAHAGLQRGDLLTSIDGKVIDTWKALELALVSRIGESGEILFEVSRQDSRIHASLAVENWLADTHQPQPAYALGLIPWQPVTPPRLAQVAEDSAAARAGLQVGDLIIEANDQPIDNWRSFVAIVQDHAEKLLVVKVEREGAQRLLELIPQSRPSPQNPDVDTGYAGVGVAPVAWPEDKLLHGTPGFFASLHTGVNDSVEMIKLIGISIAKLVQGDIAFSNLSGPVGIVKYAGESAQSGWMNLLVFAAYMSMSLGLLNLLPLPVLDGGQALLIMAEAVAGKPISDIWRAMLMRISMAMLLALMAITTFNDLLRLW